MQKAGAALEGAIAQLEIALSADPDWRAVCAGAAPARRAVHERALAGNPVYRAWELLGRAADAMRSDGTVRHDGEASVAAPAEAGAERPRVALRHVLKRIRQDAAADEAPLPAPDRAAAAPVSRGGPRQNQAGVPDDDSTIHPVPPAISAPDFDIGEATVSFVVREPAAPAPHSTPLAPAGPAAERRPSSAAADAEDDGGTEAEVVIVARRS